MSSVLSNESVPGAAANANAAVPERDIHRGIPRWADAIGAGIALILLAPVVAVSAAAIALTSGFPVFFWQNRVGRNGRTFAMVKLRTMKVSSDGLQITRRGDERITDLGRFFRRTKIDELPALWNVFRGDMALVGPRPEVPRYVTVNDPLWQTILLVRPGITDPVTIWLRNEERVLAAVGDPEAYYVNELQPAKLQGYVDYLQRRTLRSDIRVLWQTLTAVLAQS